MQDSKYLLRDKAFQRLFTLLFWITLRQFSEHESAAVCDLGKVPSSRAWSAKAGIKAGRLARSCWQTDRAHWPAWRQSLALRSRPLYTSTALSRSTACELLAQCTVPEDQVRSRDRLDDDQLNFRPEGNNRYKKQITAPRHFRRVLVLKSEYNTQSSISNEVKK